MNVQEARGHTRAEAIKITSAKFLFTRRTMYNAVYEMETKVDVPDYVEKLVSKKT
jgi:hypothetical protein